MHRHEVEPSDASQHTTMRHGGDLLTPVEPSMMARLEPLAKLLVDSLASKDPAINDSFNAAWRAFALRRPHAPASRRSSSIATAGSTRPPSAAS